MLASLEAAAVFAVLIVPGLLLLGGYHRTRAHALPQRDLYALTQAVVASLAWLPVLWFLGGWLVLEWLQADALAAHQPLALVIVISNIVVALTAGLAAGRAIDAIGGAPDSWPARALHWTGIFAPPTAWDAIWLYAATAQWAAVEIRLKGGEQFSVLFDKGSTVGLSPNPRQLFFDTEYTWVDGELEVLEHEGVYIDASEVVSVRLEHLEPS